VYVLLWRQQQQQLYGNSSISSASCVVVSGTGLCLSEAATAACTGHTVPQHEWFIHMLISVLKHDSKALTSCCPPGTFCSACAVAPAGSYLDKGIGKLCQKGTYSTGLNSITNCIPCPDGITTAAEGSTTADAYSLAVKGYYINPANSAEAIKCPLDTYQDQEAAVTSCTACPNGWKTKETGASGFALCLAPPGFELKDGAATITACAAGSYKADWNRNLCVAVSCRAYWVLVNMCRTVGQHQSSKKTCRAVQKFPIFHSTHVSGFCCYLSVMPLG
jgi:hypothetical protein